MCISSCQLIVPEAKRGQALVTANGNSDRRALAALNGFQKMSNNGKCVDSTQTRYTRVRSSAWGATTADQCASRCSTELGSADVAGFGLDTSTNTCECYIMGACNESRNAAADQLSCLESAVPAPNEAVVGTTTNYQNWECYYIGSPTKSPSNSPTVTPEQGYVFCGSWGNSACETNEALVDLTEVHAVRCCSTEEGHGYSRCDSGSVFSDVIYGSAPDCLEQNYEEAKETCESLPGRRLCSKEEMEARCARGTGCGFDQKLVWGYMGDPKYPSSSPTNSPTGSPIMGFEAMPGMGKCVDASSTRYTAVRMSAASSVQECANKCTSFHDDIALVGFALNSDSGACECNILGDCTAESNWDSSSYDWCLEASLTQATAPVAGTTGSQAWECFRILQLPTFHVSFECIAECCDQLLWHSVF